MKKHNLLTLEAGIYEEELAIIDEEGSSDYERPHKEEVFVIKGSITVSP